MNLLIVGATGLVGINLIKLIENSNIKIKKIYFVASQKSNGKVITFRNKEYIISTFDNIDLDNIDIACLTCNTEVSKDISPKLINKNIIVIDNSSAYRNTYNLTIPEINYKKGKHFYVNPNCVVIQCLIPLFYIHKEFKIRKILYNTYQSKSGAGKDFLDSKLNNCLFINDLEEQKLIYETKKILDSNINIAANCVRVPVDTGHLVNIVIDVVSTYDDIVAILKASTKYINNNEIKDIDNDCNIYTYNLKQIDENKFSFYTYANNLLRGSAYNTFLTLKQITKKAN